MKLEPIKTRICQPPQDDLTDIYQGLVPKLRPGMIVVISSKIIAIEEGRCVPVSSVESKDDLVIQESDRYLDRKHVPNGWVMHTITDGLLIPSAGIDESNADEHYILWPKDSNASAQRIGQFLRKESGLKELGVVVTDSHSIPLRRGVVGFAVGYWGFQPLVDYRDQKDLFGREFHFSMTNLPDGLAASAVLTMGEGSEQTPIVLISAVTNLNFESQPASSKPHSSYEIPLEEDLYAPFLANAPWSEGSHGKTK